MYDIFISYNTRDQVIADEIYRRLTEEGFKCFLATEKLNRPDWAEQIEEAVENSTGFVIVVSSNANTSNEVLKEVTNATRYSRYIFPFMIDDSKLGRQLNYHLSPFQWIQAVIPPMELRYQDLVQRVKNALREEKTEGNLNVGKIELIGQKVSPRVEFLGREKELHEIRQLFENGEQNIFVYGMGGMGKSELARAYAKEYKDFYDIVVMASYESDLLHLLTNDHSINIKGCQRGGVNAGQQESEEYYFKRKYDVLEGIVNDRTLIIIDNFDTEEDEHLEKFINLNCNKIFTTRVNFEELGYPVVEVRTMDAEKNLLPLMEKMDHKYTKDEDREAAIHIIHILENHTYAVSLTASQMKAGHIQPKKMEQMLIAEGLNYQTRSGFVRNAGDTKKNASDYIRMLFDFAALSEKECEIMRYMACMPNEGVDIDLFMEISDVDDFEDLRKLFALNWLQEDLDNNICRIHMLVRELAYERLNPCIDNCKELLERLSRKLESGGWHNTLEENLFVEPVVLSVLRCFPKPTVEVYEIFDNLSTFAWIMNHFDESEKAAKALYDSCVEECGEWAPITGKQATRVAAVFHNKNDRQSARSWYEKGKDVLMHDGKDSAECVTAIYKVARGDMMCGNLKDAEAGLILAGEMVERLGVEYQDKAQMLHEIKVKNAFIQSCYALVKGGRGEYDDAVKTLLEQYEIVRGLIQGPFSGFYIRRALGIVYQSMGEIDKALDIFKNSYELSLEYHGDNKDTIVSLELCGDTCTISGNTHEAAEYYEQALNKLERNFPGDVEGKLGLEKKYETANRGETFEIPYRYIEL